MDNEIINFIENNYDKNKYTQNIYSLIVLK